MRRVRLLSCVVFAVFLSMFSLAAHAASSSGAEPDAFVGESAPEGARTTPELIEAACQRGEISAEAAALCQAVALTDYASLPPEFRSNVHWYGTVPLLTLR